MDFGTFIVAIFSVAAGCGVPVGIVALALRHKQQMAELSRPQAQVDTALAASVAVLRDEVARLRDTTTQYDISVEHTLTEMKQRIATLESKTSDLPVQAPQHPANGHAPVSASSPEQTEVLRLG